MLMYHTAWVDQRERQECISESRDGSTVQLNLNLTEHTCSMASTQHIFHFTCAQA